MTPDAVLRGAELSVVRSSDQAGQAHAASRCLVIGAGELAAESLLCLAMAARGIIVHVLETARWAAGPAAELGAQVNDPSALGST